MKAVLTLPFHLLSPMSALGDSNIVLSSRSKVEGNRNLTGNIVCDLNHKKDYLRYADISRLFNKAVKVVCKLERESIVQDASINS